MMVLRRAVYIQPSGSYPLSQYQHPGLRSKGGTASFRAVGCTRTEFALQRGSTCAAVQPISTMIREVKSVVEVEEACYGRV
jgi:hypothetical protein